MPKTSNRYFERTFEFIVPRLWNNLPLQLRIFVTKEEVKRNLKKWFKSNLKMNTHKKSCSFVIFLFLFL